MYLFKSLKSRSLSFVCITLLIASCATQEQSQSYRSFLESSNQSDVTQEPILNNTVDSFSSLAESEKNNLDFKKLQLLEKVQPEKYLPQPPEELYTNISEKQLVQITADEMPLDQFLHYAFGELIGINYIIDKSLENTDQDITLNITDSISKRELFILTEELLADRGFKISYQNKIYSIHKMDSESQGTIVYAYGNDIEDVPQTNLKIAQVVSFDFGEQSDVFFRLTKLTDLIAIPNKRQNALILQGKRSEIIKALEYIKFFDQPLLKDRFISFYEPVFVSTTELAHHLETLLAQDGIEFGKGKDLSKAVTMIEMSRIGTAVFFTTQKYVLDRIDFWINKIDVPLKGDESQYFYYLPKYASAVDIGDSLNLLISNGSAALTRVTAENENNTQVSNVTSGNGVKIVTDTRTNSLIVFSSGEKYQKLLPIIERLDVLPKQIVLEVLIAEVSLTDEFKQGVEFAIQNANYGISTSGAFMGAGFGGLSYVLSGVDGSLTANFLQSNSLVNIISRPTLVVKDGNQASIKVGTDIPVVGSTTSDPLTGQRQTTNIVYRSTGVELSVTPSVNAQNSVNMIINQSISNQVDSGTTANLNPSVFQRSLSTEVIAASGQTVLLGGLISENKSQKNTKVPLLGNLPLIGNLFSSKSNGGDKTELIVMVTPKVIQKVSDLDELKESFYKAFEYLK